VVLTVGRITPLGAILRGTGAIKPKREIGGNNTKRAKTLNHKSIVELTSIAYCYDMLLSCKFSFTMIFVGAC